MSVDIIKAFRDIESWAPGQNQARAPGLEAVLEEGNVLYFPGLAFPMEGEDARFLSERWSDGKAKNISLRGPGAGIRGAAGSPEDIASLAAMMTRYSDSAERLVKSLFPAYGSGLRRGFTSFRPHSVTARDTSWRKDDTRLHIDSFPSNPTGGLRLLRVFSNVNPSGEPRVWRVGEPFGDFAAKFLPRTRPQLPGIPWLLNAFGATKSLRTEYDHLMLQLHDFGKADVAYQRSAPQQSFPFPAGSTWIVYSDQVLHAAMSGQYLLEQTFYLPPENLTHPEGGPLRVLEQWAKRSLLPTGVGRHRH